MRFCSIYLCWKATTEPQAFLKIFHSSVGFTFITFVWTIMALVNGTLPIFGYPGIVFHIIHIVALISCSLSAIFSLSVIVFSFINERRKARPRKFTKWNRGERLAIYLAMFDFSFSSFHMMDHAYIYITITIPPDALCRAFAFLVYGCALGQAMMVFCLAVITCIQVYAVHHVCLGKHDWKLLVTTTGIPFTYVTVGVILKYMGPDGAW